jgi:hypothetical protein
VNGQFSCSAATVLIADPDAGTIWSEGDCEIEVDPSLLTGNINATLTTSADAGALLLVSGPWTCQN